MHQHMGRSWMKRLLGARCFWPALAVGAALGCQGDSDSDDSPAYVGGWGNEANHLYACFDDERRMWLGDSLTEIGGTSYCTVDEAGRAFHCTDPGGGSPFDGVLEASSDELTLRIVPCPPGDPSQCELDYAREPSVTCE
jgi:hypothetical protein